MEFIQVDTIIDQSNCDGQTLCWRQSYYAWLIPWNLLSEDDFTIYPKRETIAMVDVCLQKSYLSFNIANSIPLHACLMHMPRFFRLTITIGLSAWRIQKLMGLDLSLDICSSRNHSGQNVSFRLLIVSHRSTMACDLFPQRITSRH